MPHPLLDDPYVAREIELALRPYAAHLPRAELAWMREQLAETLATDPVAFAALRRAHPRDDVDQSGEVETSAERGPRPSERAG